MTLLDYLTIGYQLLLPFCPMITNNSQESASDTLKSGTGIRNLAGFTTGDIIGDTKGDMTGTPLSAPRQSSFSMRRVSMAPVS
jgi:hypothetical protein